MNKKFIYALVVIAALFGGYFLMNSTDNKPVVIYSSMEDFRNMELEKQLKERFPEINTSVQYYPTGKSASKLKAEGGDTEADIVLGLESAYMNELNSMFVKLSNYDTSKFLDTTLNQSANYFPWEKYTGVIVVNTKALKELGLPEPTSYNDLVNPIYKNNFIMPDPKTSGTAYMMLYDVNKRMGDTAANKYFDDLAKNTKQFTASGSAPINALVQGECPVAWGLVLKASDEKSKGAPLKIIIPEGGAPFNTTGFAVVAGKEKRENVKKIFDFLYNDFIYYDKEHFSPDQIFKKQECKVPNYPKDIKYSDMSGIEDMKTKEHLLDNWKY